MNSFFLHLTKFVHFQIRTGKGFWAKIEQAPVRLLKSPVYKSSVEEGEFFQKSRLEVFSRKRCSRNKQQIYWNHTSAWMFSRKFAIYFQANCFFKLNNPLTFFLIFFSLILEVVMKKFKVKRQSCIYFAFTEAVFRRVL